MRGFDRTDPDYGPIDVLLDDRLKGFLDRLMEEDIDAAAWEKVLDRAPFLTAPDPLTGTMVTSDPHLHLSGSEKARLRLAVWFWNDGLVKLRRADFFVLDPGNRRRLMAAFQKFLGIPWDLVLHGAVPDPDAEGDQQAELDALAGQAQAQAEDEARAQALDDRARDEAEAHSASGPEGDPNEPPP